MEVMQKRVYKGKVEEIYPGASKTSKGNWKYSLHLVGSDFSQDFDMVSNKELRPGMSVQISKPEGWNNFKLDRVFEGYGVETDSGVVRLTGQPTTKANSNWWIYTDCVEIGGEKFPTVGVPKDWGGLLQDGMRGVKIIATKRENFWMVAEESKEILQGGVPSTPPPTSVDDAFDVFGDYSDLTADREEPRHHKFPVETSNLPQGLSKRDGYSFCISYVKDIYVACIEKGMSIDTTHRVCEDWIKTSRNIFMTYSS